MKANTIINNLVLPSKFIEDINNDLFKREIGCWNLIKSEDYFGNILETEIGEVYSTQNRISEETRNLHKSFKADGFYGENIPDLKGPGAIPDIIDFAKIICFALSGDGSPFCFDYRNSSVNPSIIWWDDVCWRKIAPDYESFIRLFNFDKD